MARVLTWLVKCKGKHICSAKPALLDFDKPAYCFSAPEQNGLNECFDTAWIADTGCTENGDNKIDKENEKPHKLLLFLLIMME